MRRFSGPAAWLVSVLYMGAASAADHQDGAAVKTDPASDINDVFAWTSPDGTKLNLAMTVFPFATTSAKFSDAVQYVFHTSSGSAYGTAATASEDIVCTFNAAQTIQCWGGGEYVTGNANATAGIASANGKLKVFAGPRDDPFFFNLDGFKAVAKAVHDAAPALVSGGAFDAAGCPALDQPTADALVTQLRSKPGPGGTLGNDPPEDHFAGANGLAIVIQIDKALVTKGGPVVGVYASTNK